MHTTGLLLHEFGGHALASLVWGCGIDGYDLTFFGHGLVHYAPCTKWTPTTIIFAEWAGLLVTITAAVGVFIFVRRAKLSPMARVLASLLGYFFLLGQLGYATTGGFHDLYDPGHTARLLGARGIHVLAWVPPMIAHASVSFFGARAVVDAFRDQFGSRLRLLVLAGAGALYLAAFRIEFVVRADMAMKGVAVEAKRVAVATGGPPPFPIEHVLTGVAVLGLVLAIARKREAHAPLPIAPPLVRVVAYSAAACLVLLAALIVTRAKT